MVSERAFQEHANREKRRVALTSVTAAVFLTSMKLAVGLLTGSLGILSEAAHSGLDLAAAGVTLIAVRLSGRPADRNHTYGHGKIENLSALFETVLLLVTCVWIILEAIQRLFFKHVEVEVNLWSFLVMGTSIVIDVSRSRALARVARKYRSQALEADALHFSTDVWSSSVVILGLALVALAGHFEAPWLVKADAVAALGVAAIVVYVSLQLGGRTISALLDAVPAPLRDELVHAARVPGVVAVRRVRIRQSGPENFADVTLQVSPETTLDRAHAIASEAEAAVRQILPEADVMVHVEPGHTSDASLVATARNLASLHGLDAHAIRIFDLPDGRSLELHLEVSESLSVEQAHLQASAFEADLVRSFPAIRQVITHLEPAGDSTAYAEAHPVESARIAAAVSQLARDEGLEGRLHQVEVNHSGGELSLSLHCAVEGGASIAEAHALTVRLERDLRARLPGLARVIIHVEPPEPSPEGAGAGGRRLSS